MGMKKELKLKLVNAKKTAGSCPDVIYTYETDNGYTIVISENDKQEIRKEAFIFNTL
jgi:hypothetical protein